MDDGYTFTLKNGYTYQVTYLITASDSQSFRFQIVPIVEGVINVPGQAAATNTVINGRAIGSVSGSFIIAASIDTELYFLFTSSNNDVDGTTGNLIIYPIG